MFFKFISSLYHTCKECSTLKTSQYFDFFVIWYKDRATKICLKKVVQETNKIKQIINIKSYIKILMIFIITFLWNHLCGWARIRVGSTSAAKWGYYINKSAVVLDAPFSSASLLLFLFLLFYFGCLTFYFT